jgi:glycosyltransferase involved in cell wall biosynthesis
LRNEQNAFVTSVTCIMPTANRRRFVPSAIELFLAQDYNDKELVIVDDGTDAVSDLVPAHPQIRYFRESPGTRSLGEKRNFACELSRGDIILHWDDDDWYAPWRIAYQAEWLRSKDLELCGLDQPLFVDAAAGEAWEYTLMPAATGWLCGATLGYRKSFWREHPFPHVRIGEDTRFTRAARGARMGALADNRCFLARIHAANTASKRPRGRWPSRPMDMVRSMVGSDWDCYFGAQDGLPLMAPPNKVGTALITASSSVSDIIRVTPVIRAAYYLGYDVDVRIALGDPFAWELLRDAREIRRLFTEPDDRRKRGSRLGFENEADAYDVEVAATVSLPLETCVSARQRYVLDLDHKGSGEASAIEYVLRSLGWQGQVPSPFVATSTRRFGLAPETVAIHAGRRFRTNDGEADVLQELTSLFSQVALIGAVADSGNGGAAFGRNLDWPRHVHDFVGKLDLRDTAALLSQCAALITADYDLMNLGVALCVGTFGILGSESQGGLIWSPFFVPLAEPASFDAATGLAERGCAILRTLSASEIAAHVTTTLRARLVVRQIPAARSQRHAQGKGPPSGTTMARTSRHRPFEGEEERSVRDRLNTRPVAIGLRQKALWRTGTRLPIPPESYDKDYFEGGLRGTWPRGYTWSWCGEVFTETAAMLHAIFPDAMTYLDAGCGKGFLVRALFERGLEARGFDHSAWAIANAEPAIRHLVSVAAAETAECGDRSADVLVAMSLLENLTDDQVRLFLVRAKRWVREALFATVQTGRRAPGVDACPTVIRDDQWWCHRFAESGWKRSELQEVVQSKHLAWRMRWAAYVLEPIQ